jgi:glycine/D-amino acid oxidase-like deaminating enzyme
LSGLRLPGNNLYPLRFVSRLFQLACEEAARVGIEVVLHTHTPVTAIEENSLGSWHARTSRGTIAAKAVVHATNAYASHLIPSLLTTDRPVVPCRAQVMAIRPKDDRKFWTAGFCKRQSLYRIQSPTTYRFAFTAYNEGFEYFFQRPKTHSSGAESIPYIILGGGRSVAPAPHELGVADDSSLNPAVSTYLRNFLPEHFRSASDTIDKQIVDYHWTGIMGFTPSRNPIVGPVYVDGIRQPRQYILAGFSGHGVSRAGSWYALRLA